MARTVVAVPYTLGPGLSPTAYAAVRRHTIFRCSKWDPQVGDVAVLARYPLILAPFVARKLAGWAEQLAAEALAAEEELRQRPDLVAQLGLPRAICRAVRRGAANGPLPPAPRYVRFDFHYTSEGWRISEANTDVPGGLLEASGFTAAIARETGAGHGTANPLLRLAEALARAAGGVGGRVALVHATAYTDDRQVVIALRTALAQLGVSAELVSPAQVRWDGGLARLACDWSRAEVQAVFRFFPGEWLPNLPWGCHWQAYCEATRTPQCNPATALLPQSKRFPLIWDRLATSLPTWRHLLPETRAPQNVSRRERAAWVWKPALGRVGEGIGISGVTRSEEWRRIRRGLWWAPQEWALQRRFDALPVDTPDGPRYPCLGVFVVDGRAAGIYGRWAPVPLIDARAQDVAVLVAQQVTAVQKEVVGGWV